MKTKVFIAALGAAGLAGTGALAQAGLDWTTTGSTGTNQSWIMGYSFVANDNVAVTALGYFDEFGDGLTESHDVGLWDINGNLLATAVVTNGDALVGNFRWSALEGAVNLSAGSEYVVGGVSGSENYAWDNFGMNVNSAITVTGDRFLGGSSLLFPDGSTGRGGGDGNNGFFGGNIWLGEVPAPGALALLGVAGLVSRRRRR